MVFQKPLNNFRYIVYYCHTKIKKNKQKETVTKVLSQQKSCHSPLSE
ncbi:ribonuclease P [Enterococcus faecium]|nr:ribonuclease P [Enterococcus faecium]